MTPPSNASPPASKSFAWKTAMFTSFSTNNLSNPHFALNSYVGWLRRVDFSYLRKKNSKPSFSRLPK
jgi:hypothetical protein